MRKLYCLSLYICPDVYFYNKIEMSWIYSIYTFKKYKDNDKYITEGKNLLDLYSILLFLHSWSLLYIFWLLYRLICNISQRMFFYNSDIQLLVLLYYNRDFNKAKLSVLDSYLLPFPHDLLHTHINSILSKILKIKMTSFILPSFLSELLPLVELERGDIQLLCNFESLLSKMFLKDICIFA